MSLELRAAVEEQDDGKLGGICERLFKVLASQPSRINDRLVTTAGQLALGAVADTLRKVCAAAANMLFDEEAQSRLGEFTKGIDSLGQLDRNLSILINNHNCLQEIDDSLRRFELTLRPSPVEIAETWVDLAEPLGHLEAAGGATWIAELRQLSQGMDTPGGAAAHGTEGGARVSDAVPRRARPDLSWVQPDRRGSSKVLRSAPEGRRHALQRDREDATCLIN